MNATELVSKVHDPQEWRKHARALRRAGDALWDKSTEAMGNAALEHRESSEELDLTITLEFIESAKLLYGLSLETALKARIVEQFPEQVEVRLIMNGRGTVMSAELRQIGVHTSQGHNIIALADKVDLFGSSFRHVFQYDHDWDAVRSICRELGEVVVWRGRYPIPLTSYEPQKPDPSVPWQAHAHYLRDWLDPVLDDLLNEKL